MKGCLLWIPEYSDITGNSEADELPRAGTTLQIDTGEEKIYIPLATYRYLRK